MANILPGQVLLSAGGDTFAKYGTLVKRTTPPTRGGEIPYTLTRAGTVLGVTPGGILLPHAANIPVIDWLTDPLTLQPQAYLRLEAAATNKLTAPEDLSNVAWALTQATVPTINNTSPRGDATAAFLRENAAVGTFHGITQNFTLAVAGNKSGGTRFVKANGRTKLQWVIGRSDLASYFSVIIDTVAGTATPTVGGTGVVLFSSIAALGSGWYEVKMLGTVDGSTTAVQDQNYLMSGSSTTYTGDGVSGMFVWGCVATDNTIAGSYWGTAASKVGDSSFVIPWYYQPQASWLYLRFLEGGDGPAQNINRHVWIGGDSGSRLTVQAGGGGYVALRFPASGGGVTTGSVPNGSSGGVQELLVIAQADGSLIVRGAVNGGADSVGSTSPTLAYDAQWTTPLQVGIHASPNSNASPSTVRLSRLLIGLGTVSTLADVRAVPV